MNSCTAFAFDMVTETNRMLAQAHQPEMPLAEQIRRVIHDRDIHIMARALAKALHDVTGDVRHKRVAREHHVRLEQLSGELETLLGRVVDPL